MSRILSSWKEIAQYAGKGVRTVQRWEREFGFPVRRPVADSRHAIIAIPEEIDAWVLSQTGTERSELNRLRSEVERLRAELGTYRQNLPVPRNRKKSKVA